jgi:AraC family transcriptional regulator of adaptative response/methylated-DNA-[protein]-cysteine methyltransferase
MTFFAYQRARRMGQAMREVRNGHSVTAAQVGAGFESSSGFRDAFSRLFGVNASRSDGVVLLTSTWLTTPLGPMLAIAHDEGLVLLDFVDCRGLERAILRLRRRFSVNSRDAVIVPGEHPHLRLLNRELSEYFDGRLREFSVPLYPTGSEFQLRAWNYLRSIPHGQTRSYLDEAIALRDRKAVRAVGRANGTNCLSIVIPCHRVVAANGDLTGYAGGLARKRWLLDHEKQHARLTGSGTPLRVDGNGAGRSRVSENSDLVCRSST